MSLLLYFHKIFKSKLLATAYHEAAHCVVAYFFNEKISIKELAINKKYLEKMDPKLSGGLNIEFNEIPTNKDLDVLDHIILVAVAGICGQTIHNKGIEYVKNNLTIFKDDHLKMDEKGADQDYSLIEKSSKIISQTLSVRKEIIEWSAFRWTFEFLLDDKIWLSTTNLAEALISKGNKRLNYNEIENVFEQAGLKKYLESKRKHFFEKRYPIGKREFIV